MEASVRVAAWPLRVVLNLRRSSTVISDALSLALLAQLTRLPKLAAEHPLQPARLSNL